jgi:hypothetical protein
MIRDHGQMAGGVRRGERPADSKRMLSFMLFAQGAILIILTAIVALQAECWGRWALASCSCLSGHSFVVEDTEGSETLTDARFGSAPEMKPRPPPIPSGAAAGHPGATRHVPTGVRGARRPILCGSW